MKVHSQQVQLDLNLHEKEVLKTLAEYEGYRTTAEIARKSKVSWSITFKFLHRLKEKGWINYIKKGTWEYWKAKLG